MKLTESASLNLTCDLNSNWEVRVVLVHLESISVGGRIDSEGFDLVQRIVWIRVQVSPFISNLIDFTEEGSGKVDFQSLLEIGLDMLPDLDISSTK